MSTQIIKVNDINSDLQNNINIEDFDKDLKSTKDGKPNVTFFFKLQNLVPANGILAGSITTTKVCLGVGTLGIPYALTLSGVIPFIVGLIITSLITIYSMYLLCVVSDITNLKTYELLGSYYFGKWMKYCILFLTMCFCWGTDIIFITAINGILTNVTNTVSFPTMFQGVWGVRLLTTIFWIIVMLPISLPKHISALRYGSFLGVLANTVLAIVLLIHAVMSTKKFSKNSETSGSNIPLFVWGLNLIVFFPTIIFAYGPQTNCFEIYQELSSANKTPKKMALITFISMIFCSVFYAFCGLIAVSNFGFLTKSNILNNYNLKENKYIIVAFLAVVISLVFSFPINIFPSRDSILQLFGYDSVYKSPNYLRVTVSGALSVTALLFGILVPKLSIMLNLVGGIAGSTLSIIFPALFALMTKEWACNITWKSIVPCWTMIVFGSLAGIFGTGITIYQLAVGTY